MIACLVQRHTFFKSIILILFIFLKSPEGFRIFSKKRLPGWWIPNLPFRNLKSGFTKDILIQLLTNFRDYIPEDTPEVDYRTTENITASPHRDRSPPIIRIPLATRSPKRATYQDLSSSQASAITPPTPFQNLCEAEPSSSSSPSPLLDSFSEPHSYLDARDDSDVGQEVEIQDDVSDISSLLEPFFPYSRTASQTTPLPTHLSFFADIEKTTTLSELTGNTYLTDVTIHVFMVCYNLYCYLNNYLLH